MPVRLPRKRTYTPDDLGELVSHVLGILRSQGITQQQIADEMGVAQPVVSQAGPRGNVKLTRRLLERYADATLVEDRTYRVVPLRGGGGDAEPTG